MDGLDIALSQAPPIHWLPPNINMRVWNIFEDLPEDPMGQFDIVHVRLLFLVVLNNDAVPVINNLSQMQKPGGYLQWEELNACDHHVVTVGPAVRTGAFEQMRRIMDGQGRLEWMLRLYRSMDENGVEKSEIYHYRDGMELAKAHSDMLLAMLEELAVGGARSEERGGEDGERMMGLIPRV